MNNYSRACTGTSVQAAPINTGRKSLVLQNQDPSRTFWVGFGQAATQGGLSLAVRPGVTMGYTEAGCPTEAIMVNGPAGLLATVHEQ